MVFGRVVTVHDLAAAWKINSCYVSRILRLKLLVLDLVEAILDGRQPEGMTLPGLMGGAAAQWEKQQVLSNQWQESRTSVRRYSRRSSGGDAKLREAASALGGDLLDVAVCTAG